MSGNCGLECRGFLDRECGIPDEIIEGHIDDLQEELLIHKFGELRLAVARRQTKVDFDEHEQAIKMVLSGEAREYFGY
ncbi:MAG: hypothetical protein JAY90_20320 [Candidatus Thiodiazotropha lotti]|nr:hypothetical protein [Candidatus Thiodiazotropha lotti]